MAAYPSFLVVVGEVKVVVATVSLVLVHVVIWRLDHHAKMGASLLSIGS
jgi:hypothetical protein